MKRPKRLLLVGAAAAALAMLCAAPSTPRAATSSMTVVQLSREADLIVRGRVARVEGRWNGDRSAIHSDVAVAVRDTLKGSLPTTAAGRRGEVVFSVLGGEVDGVTMVSSSDALPAVGEEMVLFLRSAASAAAAARAAGSAGAGSAATPLALVGQERGAYPVRSDRIELGDGREIGIDEFLAAVTRSAK
jgi:hypothetical protein